MRFQKLLPVAFMLILAGCGGGGGSSYAPDPIAAPEPDPDPVSVVDVAVADGSFTTLVAALQATGLDETLSDMDSKFTVFAPTDAAFALLGQETIDALLADTDTLSDILTYHVIASEVDSSTARSSAGSLVEMVNGDSVGLSLDGDNLLVNTATVTIADVMADNGVIHVIDAVLTPPVDKGEPTMNIVETAVAAGSFDTLVATLQATGLDTTLADETLTFTVFAPTDDAFAMIDTATLDLLLANTDILSKILLQHVVDGEVNSISAFSLNGQLATTLAEVGIPVSINSELDTLNFGGATVQTTDIYTTNGIIHVIDTVVIADVELPTPPASIVDVAVSNGSFTTLVAALQATGLDTVLDDPESTFTVFAPTDAAFALLGQDTINALLADPDTLKDILLYHVVSGSEILQDAAISVAQSGSNKVPMANLRQTALTLDGDNLLVNTATVTVVNVMSDNGVIHVIDAVLTPPVDKGEPTMNIVETAVAAGSFDTLVATLQATGLDTTLADETLTFTVFAPTDDAFAMIDTATLDLLLANTDILSKILLQHVVDGEVNSISAFSLNGQLATTLAEVGIPVSINSELDTLNFGGATVQTTDIYTTNGIIHVIDTVVIADVELPTPPTSIVDFAVSVEANNDGSGNVYVIGGVQRKALTLEVGTTYTFTHPSGHPLLFSETGDGTHSGGSAYTAGVDSSVSGTTVIEVTASTPQILYYYCSIHPRMGSSATQ